jgi:hypothetical protein
MVLSIPVHSGAAAPPIWRFCTLAATLREAALAVERRAFMVKRFWGKRKKEQAEKHRHDRACVGDQNLHTDRPSCIFIKSQKLKKIEKQIHNPSYLIYYTSNI